jgi:hypothetical protein
VADVLAVDEHVDVRAEAAELVDHPLVHARIVAAQRPEQFGHGGAAGCQLEHARAAGVLPQRSREVQLDTHGQLTAAALTHSTGGSHSASSFQESPSSALAKSSPVRVPK